MTIPTPDEICERLREADRNSVQRCLGSRIFAEAAALIQQQQATIERLSAALEVFARCPTHGKYGGPFVIASASFEDMCDGDSAPRGAYWHLSDFEKARAALGKDASDDRSPGSSEGKCVQTASSDMGRGE